MNKRHLSNEDSVCCPNHIELCTKLPLNKGHLSNEDSQLCPKGALIERFHCTMYCKYCRPLHNNDFHGVMDHG